MRFITKRSLSFFFFVGIFTIYFFRNSFIISNKKTDEDINIGEDKTQLTVESETESTSSSIKFQSDILSDFVSSLSLQATATSLIQLSPAPVSTPISATQPAKESASVNRSLWDLVNQHRASIGLVTLQYHNGLCGYANKRKDTILGGSHNGFMQDNWKDYCPECNYMGEVIARGYVDAEKILSKWLASGSHKNIVEGNWIYGCVQYLSLDVAVGEFGRP